MNRTPGLTTFTGNRPELLARRLCEGLRVDPLPPTLREQIVVPSRGMGAWLERQIALDAGIAASIDFPFPARFVDRLAEKFGFGRPEPVDPFRPVAQLFELHELFWEISKAGPQVPALEPVASHLEGDVDGRKRYQLARRLSGLYAGYQFARPGGIEAWRRGKWFAGDAPIQRAGEPWQRALFNQLAERHADDPVPAQRILELLRILDGEDIDAGLLPPRVAVFGASTMPPVLAQVFLALSRHVPVEFYLLAPTAEYYGDLRGRSSEQGERTAAEELVAVLGRLGSEFFDALVGVGVDPQPVGFAEGAPRSLLHQLQFAMSEGIPEASMAIDPADRSVRLHSCHSPLREMEVLRDEVLAALADGTADSVSDILLLVPDIRTYAPFARSVFGAEIDNGEGRSIRMPIRVADRSGATAQPYARLILQWLALASSRLTLSEVFPVLQEAVVARHFGFGPEQLDELRDRLRDAGVIWGVDPDWRAERTGTPRFDGVSWREGIDRLLLGCFTGPVDAMIDGVLPAADAAVSNVETLGQLATALDRLFALLAELDGPHPMEEWAAHLRRGLGDLTDATDERRAIERAECIGVLDRLVDDAGGSTAPVGRLALVDLLTREFAAMDAGGGLVGGAITVAELRPMRSLPAKVIAVAGMDAESFPRRDPRDGLDLVAETRQAGDRSPRDDDRQLFLELLLCARERLIVSWVGRDQHDDHERTLSPCAQELVDTLEAFGFREHTIQHSLQPFASAGWKESTYDHAFVRAAGALTRPERIRPFIDAELDSSAGAEAERVELADLQAFWKSPAAWFCRRAADIGMAFDREEAEAEALGLDGLQAWKLRDAALRHPDALDDEERLCVRFGLPANALVTQDVRAVRREFDAFAGEAGFGPADLVEEEIEIPGDDFVVGGTVRRLADGPLVSLIAGSKKKKYTVQQIVAHAVAGCAQLPGPSLIGSVRKPDELERWEHFTDPHEVLARLVAGYRLGRRRPLRFFPRTSLAFAKAFEGPDSAPLEVFGSIAVQNEWSQVHESSQSYAEDGEVHDEAVALCVRGLTEPELCNEEFLHWAKTFGDWLEQIGGEL